MTVETYIFDTLKTLVANRVYPDTAPANVARPYIIYQSVGGQAVNFLEASPPGIRNTRMQISVYADTRLAAAAMAHQVEDAMINGMNGFVLDAPISIYENDVNLYGTHQDFSLWY
jgi:hypothetical protein